MGLQEGVDMMSRYGAATKEGGNGDRGGSAMGVSVSVSFALKLLVSSKTWAGSVMVTPTHALFYSQ